MLDMTKGSKESKESKEKIFSTTGNNQKKFFNKKARKCT